MRVVHVDVAPSYDVHIGPGALGRLPEATGRLALLVDETVERLHGARIDAAFAGRRVERTTLPSGEAHKTLATASALYDWLAARRIERSEAIVAIGGGVTGDVAGFVAATWQRGVPLVQVPTTLLAQVDSSVGGKVAVDHPAGKNLIGAFHQPRLVLAEPAFLATLPPREMWSGLAEVVKTALLAGEPLFSLVASELEALAAGASALEEVVARCVAYKASVVKRDPSDHGERAVLNLGHTAGHALEKASHYEGLLHGEAVAYGLRAALALSGHGASSPARRLVSRLVVPPLPKLAVEAVLEAMRSDKKVADGQARFVLLPELGRPTWGQLPAPGEVRRVVEALLEGAL
jgi:3-dehydroquinate synthase